MIEKGLAYYLEYPEHVSELTRQELLDLIEAYPYAQSLRWLLARHSLDTGQTAYQKEDILNAAIYSEDLIFLRHQLLRKQSDLDELKANDWSAPDKKVTATKANLETIVTPPQDIISEEEVDKKEEKKTPQEIVEPQASDVAEKPNEKTERKSDQSIGSKEVPVEKPKNESEKEVEPSKPEVVKPKKTRTRRSKVTAKVEPPKSEAAVSKEKEEEEIKKVEKKESEFDFDETLSQMSVSTLSKAKIIDDVLSEYDANLSEFSKWLLNQELEAPEEPKETPKLKKEEKKKKAKKKKKKSKKSKLQKLIDHSLVEREELVTETYADLVATQGHTAKAIELYERLMLKFPEKSSYFARKIDEIKKS